ncbi:MarR family winged helix-turn-helix transcriptional regulator [Paenibacillus thalictri]|uniref:MarR family transcriptional regulator n=1 Tax=Paenibacillus thalictri TaxID=2527873 RepID=A0A4Q9DJL9_9BACL|nr:MarR family transcriptional regulator [Paenibacillus thalictri]TBL74534.1 MarR family transcriptional regulator [Paenibacillus thalictri]
METKEIVFRQLTAVIASAHQLHYEMLKDVPLDDLTPLQYEIMEFLWVKQPQTLSQISECKGISMPNTSREIKRLSELGFCQKLEDREDRRKQHIHLTELGEKRMSAVFDHMREHFYRRIRGIPEDKLGEVSAAMALLESTILRV